MQVALPHRLIALVLSFSGVAAQAADPILIELSAGAVARRETPIRFTLPADMKPPGPWKLLRDGDGKNVPVQLDELGPPALVWILEEELPAGKKRRYRLESGATEPATVQVECKDVAGKHLLFTAREKNILSSREKNILRYNYGLVEPPEGVEPIFARSGYMHPVWTPSGSVITNDSPANHKHHHGIWMPWTNTLFEGRPVNFWEQGEGLGKVEAVGVDVKLSGPVFGGFRARHRFLDLKAPGGPKPVLNEVWDVKVYALDRFFLVDFTSVQTCAGESPLLLKEYRYGGFGFRGSAEWEGEEGAEFLTSEGKTRKDGHATTARWCEVRGKVKGEAAGVAFLCHPANFRAPQPMRIHPSEPFFNFTPCQAGDFQIVPGKPYESRYRMVLHDGAAEPSEVERYWKDYSEPPAVERVKS